MSRRSLAMLILVNAIPLSRSPTPQTAFNFHDLILANHTIGEGRVDNAVDRLWAKSILAESSDDLWSQSVARGTKLLLAMHADDNSAASLYGLGSTAESPFDGSLESTLTQWGYADNTPNMQSAVDNECNFASTSGHMLSKAFAALGIQTRNAGNGVSKSMFPY